MQTDFNNLLDLLFRTSLLKCKNSNDNSLYSGKSGLLVFYFLYSKYKTGDGILRILESLLEEICYKFHLNTSLSFKYGFPGIAYAFMFLYKNNFLEGELGLILENLDKIMFERRGHQVELVKGGIEGAGYYLYFLERYKFSVNGSSYQQKYLKHILIYLIDEIENLVENTKLDTPTEFSIIYFLIEIAPYKVNELKVRNCLATLRKKNQVLWIGSSAISNIVLNDYLKEILLSEHPNGLTCHDLARWSLFFRDNFSLSKIEVVNPVLKDEDLVSMDISLERGISGLGISILNQKNNIWLMR